MEEAITKSGATTNSVTEVKDKPRPRWSTVWRHCTDLKNGKALCNLCGVELAYNSHISKSTYNLKRHLRLKHSTVGIIRRNRTVEMWKVRHEEDPKRSSVWAYCTIVGERRVQCDVCKCELVYLNGSTHNLKRHLEAKHTAEALEHFSKNNRMESINASIKRSPPCKKAVVLSSAISEALQGSAGEIPVTATNLHEDSSDSAFTAYKPLLSLTKQRYFDNALLDLLGLDFQPVAIVDDIGFRDFVSQLQPKYILPQQRSIYNTMLPQRQEQLVRHRQLDLQQVTAICLTVERWLGQNVQANYFIVTAHFIDQEFKLKSHTLSCFHYGSKNTITDLKNELVRIAEEWLIQDKVVAVVTGNSSEILTAIDLIGWPRLPCFIDTLNSVADDAMLEIEEMIAKVRATVEFCRFSVAATELLRSIQQQMEMTPVDLEPDSSSNWTSAFRMMHRFFQLREQVFQMLALLGNEDLPILSWTDWDTLGRACELMMPLYEAVIEIHSDIFMPASKAIVMVRGLLRLCRDQLAIASNAPTIEKMASVIISSITNWFGNIELNPLLAESTLLDPRFKLTGFADCTAADLAKRNIIESASRTEPADADADMSTNKQLSATCAKQSEPSTSSVWAVYDQQVAGILMQSQTVPVVKASSDATSSSVWSDYDQHVLNSSVRESPGMEAAKQLERFLDEPVLGRQCDSLDWWQTRETLYPRLVPVVKDRLCIVANCIPSEYAFSQMTFASSIRRRALTARDIHYQMFLHSNVS